MVGIEPLLASERVNRDGHLPSDADGHLGRRGQAPSARPCFPAPCRFRRWEAI